MRAPKARWLALVPMITGLNSPSTGTRASADNNKPSVRMAGRCCRSTASCSAGEARPSSASYNRPRTLKYDTSVTMSRVPTTGRASDATPPPNRADNSQTALRQGPIKAMLLDAGWSAG
jgi:hypothetical protein